MTKTTVAKNDSNGSKGGGDKATGKDTNQKRIDNSDDKAYKKYREKKGKDTDICDVWGYSDDRFSY